VTTFGNPDDKFSSAIYFSGSNMNTKRVLNITQNEKGEMYAMAERRKLYVRYLHQHKHNSQMGTNEENKILEWSKARMSSSDTHH
jgi:hypothetical protein